MDSNAQGRYYGRLAKFAHRFRTREVTKQYSYAPLERQAISEGDHPIRILKLLSEPGQPLQCEIQHVQLRTDKYWALSYEWGDTDETFSIEIVNHKERNIGQLPLTTNLYHALCNLRDTPAITSRRFWIDQLSINQADEREKSYQVNIMGLIYSCAEQVVSYLGPGKPGDTVGFALIEGINEKYEPLFGTLILGEQWLGTEWSGRVDAPEALKKESKLTKCQWELMFGIINGPWTRRIWMIQETYLNYNRDVIMLRGTWTCPWLSFARIHHLFRVGLLTSPLQMLDIATLMVVQKCWLLRGSRMHHPGYTQASVAEWSLASLLLNTGTIECTDPRDRIFALLGIAEDTALLDLTADYRLSYENVLLRVSVSFLTNYPSKSSGCPLACWSHFNSDDGLPLPSWVARWPSFYWQLTNVSSLGTASGNWTGMNNFSSDYSRLLVPGFVIAKVTNTMPSFHLGLHTRLKMNDLAHLESIFEEARRFLQYESSCCDVFIFDTMQLSCPDVNGSNPQWYPGSIDALLHVISQAKSYLTCHKTIDRVELNDFVPQLPSAELRSTISRTIDTSLRWKAFRGTDLGTLCMTSDRTEEGDLITVLRGMPSLYVLRPIGEDYQFIGAACMMGWMTGRATSEPGWEAKVLDFSIA